MKTVHRLLHAALLAPCLFATAALAASDAPAPGSLAEAFAKGKVSLNIRTRYEAVEQSNRRDATALTVRTALGFTTAPIHGFTASLEAEDVTAIDGDYAVVSSTPTSRAAVVDPVGTEVNQAWLSWKTGDTVLKGGRFALVLDNARFVGNVGWRQNMQTFEGITVQNKSVKNLTATYGYLYRINRIFGNDQPGGNWTSDSHVLNVSSTGLPIGTLTGYAYLLDFDNAAAFSCATYGISLTGTKPVGSVKLAYRAEYATQADYGSSTLNYSTDYYLADLGLVTKPATVAVGYEVLGTDNNIGFKTPLATLHAFNGWADQFLATPAGGLRDTYGRVSSGLPGGVALLAFYHDFETDTGVKLGREFDVQVTRKFGKYFTGLLKYAKFDPDSTAMPDVEKLWAQIEFAY